MIKKYLKYLKIAKIDILVYRMTVVDIVAVNVAEIDYEISSEKLYNGTTKFSIFENQKFVHHSFLYKRRSILKLLKKKGPIIGDCVTNKNYRGKSIYPFVINKIAKKLLQDGTPEVFIIVNRDNLSSIRGIEKAGFHLFAKVKANRFLLFYFQIQITAGVNIL